MFKQNKFRNRAKEGLRLTKLFFDWSIQASTWDQHSPTHRVGRSWRHPVELQPNWKTGKLEPRINRDMKVPRDRFDQVFDFIADWISLFHRNVWVIEGCTHPEEACYEIDEGGEEYGPCLYTICRDCGGYLQSLDQDADRY